MTASATQTLAAWVLGLRHEDVPNATRSYARELVLDHLGCAARGGTIDTGAAVDAAMEAMGAAEGRTTAVVGKAGLRPEWAIFSNGTAAHSIELDDTHSASSLHPAVVVIPAALATAELEGTDGRELITAIVAGYEVACRIGRALDPTEVYAKGFHPTPIVGVFAAAATAGRLMGLTEAQLVHAFGIAASQAAGRLEFFAEGAWTKRMHPGWAGHAGYTAARLAQGGFSGPISALEGRNGLLRAYGSADRVALVTAGLGAPFELAETSVKPYACCRYNQGPIDLALALAREGSLAVADIASVEVGMVSTAFPIVVEPTDRKVAPDNDVDAQFSLQYSVALGIVRGSAGLDDYAEPHLSNADLRAVAARVSAVVRPDFDARFPEVWPCAMTIVTTDGRRLTAETDAPKGDPRNRLTPDEMRAKFRGLAAGVFDADGLAAIERAVERVEDDGVEPLVAAVGGARIAR